MLSRHSLFCLLQQPKQLRPFVHTTQQGRRRLIITISHFRFTPKDTTLHTETLEGDFSPSTPINLPLRRVFCVCRSSRVVITCILCCYKTLCQIWPRLSYLRSIHMDSGRPARKNNVFGTLIILLSVRAVRRQLPYTEVMLVMPRKSFNCIEVVGSATGIRDIFHSGRTSAD